MTKTTNHSAEFFAELEGDYAPFAGKPKRESRRPWHLHRENMRDVAIWWLTRAIPFLIEEGRDPGAIEAAIAVLREAAPWPDEALVVSCAVDSEIGEILDTSSEHGSRFVVVRWQLNGDHDQRVEDLVAMTPAAAEFLAAIGGGGDE